jgi:hypothetical protein
MLALGELTRYNTVAEMYFSWILISLTGLLIFYLYRKRFSLVGYPKLLLSFLPVSLILFSLRQYESILWGFTCQIYLMIFGAVAAFILLEASKRTDVWFILSLLSAILASFSFSVGLMVWPAALLQMFISEGKRAVRRGVLWSVVSVTTFTSYFYGYVTPSHHPPLTYVLTNPLQAGRYFLTLVGAVFSYDAVTASAFGLAIGLIAAFVIVHSHNQRLLKTNGAWLSLILFSAMCSIGTTLGRGGFGFEQAMASRYTPITSLGIAGLYLVALSLSAQGEPSNSKSFSVHALLALIFIGLIVSYGVGWQQGQNTRYNREMGAYILKTYKIQSDENIRNYLYPAVPVMRERAEFIEENKLNVFSETFVNPSTLILIHSNTLYVLDTMNGRIISQQTSHIAIDSEKEKTVTISGWAVDEEVSNVASNVFIIIDGRMNIPALYGLDRPDVSEKFKNPAFRFSGFIATFSSSIIKKGVHTLSIEIVAKDGEHYYHPEQEVDFIVQ